MDELDLFTFGQTFHHDFELMGTANTSLMPEFVQMDDTLFDTLMNKLSHPGPFN